jgi:hypothetical protein
MAIHSLTRLGKMDSQKKIIQNTNQNIFVFIYLLKKSSYKTKTQISNSYYKLIWFSSYEKKLNLF